MKSTSRDPARGKPDKDGLEDLLQVRLQTKEKQAFRHAAEVAGIPLSAWVRERLRRAAIKELEEVGRRAQFLADLYPE